MQKKVSPVIDEMTQIQSMGKSFIKSVIEQVKDAIEIEKRIEKLKAEYISKDELKLILTESEYLTKDDLETTQEQMKESVDQVNSRLMELDS